MAAGQDTCPRLNPRVLFISKAHGMPYHTHEIPERGPNNLPVCSMKDVQCWSHMSTLTTDGN